MQDSASKSWTMHIQEQGLEYSLSTTRTIHDLPLLSPPTNLKIRNCIHRRTLSSIDTQGLEGSRNSSLQKVWAEDYYDIEDDGGLIDKGHRIIPSIPKPATTRTSHTSADEPPSSWRPTRGHQRTLTALLPFQISTSRSPERKETIIPSPSSTKSRQDIEVEAFIPTLTGDKDGIIKVADRSKGGIASWFTGSSASVPVGTSVIDPDSIPSSPTSNSSTSPVGPSPPTKLQKRPAPTLSERPNISMATPSRFGGFFSTTKTPKATTVQLPASELEADPLLNPELISTLFSNEGDTFSPAAFKNLQMNAEGTISKLQTGYRIKAAAIHEIISERDAIIEEKEESDMKVECLQGKIEALQLQDAERIRQMEADAATINDLMIALTEERRARAEEKEAREKSVGLVSSQANHRLSTLSIDSTGEDLRISGRRNRDSSTSILTTDSDLDSADSVFSRSRSPTLTMNTHSTRASSMRSSLTTDSTPEIHHASLARVVPNPSLNVTGATPSFSPQPRPVAQKSMFQKVLSGMTNSPESEAQDPFDGIGMGLEGCSNCRGKEASAAWDAVGLMRAENKGLKERIGELENSVDGALDLIIFGPAGSHPQRASSS